MLLEADMDGAVLVIRVAEDRIDAASATPFKEQMRDVIQTECQRAILDLTSVHFIDSSGLGALVAVMKMMAPDCRLELSGLNKTVEKVFRLTRMDTVFTIHPALHHGLRHAG